MCVCVCVCVCVRACVRVCEKSLLSKYVGECADLVRRVAILEEKFVKALASV